MNATESYALAHKIIKRCDGSRDPEVIYQCLGIELEDSFDLANLKGMYSSADRHRTIYLHRRLEGYLRKFVLMHEICHDQIPEHRRRARRMPYKEIQFFGGTNKSEREADARTYPGWLYHSGNRCSFVCARGFVPHCHRRLLRRSSRVQSPSSPFRPWKLSKRLQHFRMSGLRRHWR